MNVQARIVYLETENGSDILLTKKPYADWREIAADYPDYKTDVGPWSSETVIRYFAEEYPKRTWLPEQEIRDFFAGDETVLYAE